MAATSGSDGRAGAAAANPAPRAGSLESLSNPTFASMTAADLVVHLFGVRCASDFADASLVLSARERSAAAAEARISAAEEVAGRLREELAARALEAEAQMRRAAETEERLRAEIRALERRADEAEARAGLRRPSDASGRDRARGEVGPVLGARGPAAASEEDGGGGSADVDRPDDDISWRDDVDRTVAAGDDDDRAGVEREDGDIEADGADVDPDDALTLNQYMQKQKLLPAGVVSQDQANLPPAAPLLQAKKAAHEGGDGKRPQNSAMQRHSNAGGAILKPRASVVPPRATRSSKPREKGIIYKMVLEALKEKERITLAKLAADDSHSQQPNLRFWLYAPLPSESADAAEDHCGQATQK